MTFSHANDHYDENAFNNDDAPELAEGHFSHQLSKSRINLAQTHLRVVNLVGNLVDHLCLLAHFCAKVLVLLLDVLHNHLNLVKVALLIIDLLPRHLDQLLVRLLIQVLHVFICQMRIISILA